MVDLIKKIEEDFLVTPLELSKLARLYIDGMREFDHVKESILEMSMAHKLMEITENTQVVYDAKNFTVSCDCSNGEVTLDLGVMTYGTRVTVCKIDDTRHQLNIIADGQFKFWNDSNYVKMTSKHDTVTFMRINDNLIVGV